MATVLVTGVGGVGGTATVRSLLEHTTHDVVGADMKPLAAGLYLPERRAVIPPAHSDDWLPEVLDVIERHGVEGVLPLVDEELSRLSELRERTPADVAFVAPKTDVVDTALDKYRLARALEGHDMAVPLTKLASDVDDLSEFGFPSVLKPRRGHGSQGLEVLDAPGELEEHLAAFGGSADELIVQEFIDGTEFTTSAVVTRDDDLLAVVPKEVIQKEGNTVRGVTREGSAIARTCRSIHEALQPHGPINVQQIVDSETGTPYTIEINPRFSSTACLTVAAGVNELDLLIRDAIGERVQPPDGFRTDLQILRYTDQLFVPEGDLLH